MVIQMHRSQYCYHVVFFSKSSFFPILVIVLVNHVNNSAFYLTNHVADAGDLILPFTQIIEIVQNVKFEYQQYKNTHVTCEFLHVSVSNRSRTP